MFRQAGFTVLMALTAMTAHAGTYYVATDGKPDNDGSPGKPWPTVEHALSKVGGGHTIVVKPGIYRGPIQIAKQFAGTRERPTVIQSEVKWKAVFIGAEYHVISNSDGCDWVTVDGFEVMGGRYDGVKMNGDYNVVRNCWVHNNQAMGIAMHNQKGGLIEYNLIEFNGGHVQFDHGVYADGDDLTVCGNVVRHNASFGLHLYPSIKNSRVENNLVHGQVRRRGIIVSCPEGGGKNVIANNTVVEDQPLTIWNGNGEVVANNILVAERGGEAFSFDNGTTNVLVDYNLTAAADVVAADVVAADVRRRTPLGPHNLTGDPRFLDPTRGVFWLRQDSPAIGKGSAQYAPPTDFWGRPLRPHQLPGTQDSSLSTQHFAIDLGAFPFEPILTGKQARAGWDGGWAYHRHGNKVGLPDPWMLPSPEARPRKPPEELAELFASPEKYRSDFGNFRSPLLFADGAPVRTPADWQRRRAEILSTWHKLMGPWPPLIEKPRVETISTTRRENVTQHQLRVEIALGGEMVDALLLVPDAKVPGQKHPAALVVYYDAETGAGLGEPLRDYGWQLARRGFVALSLGKPNARITLENPPTKARGEPYLGPVGRPVRVQPLSALAYAAANAHTVLAQRPDVYPDRIGIVGHSFGGKWAMMASCLYDKFACAVWSDPGIVFDERDRRKQNPQGSVNYWDVWYLGFELGGVADPKNTGGFRKLPSEGQPRTGAYKALVEGGHDLVELHALMAPRPFLVSGGTADLPERWPALNHAIAVNRLLGCDSRVAMSTRDGHSPTKEANEQVYRFFEWWLNEAR